MLGPLATDSYLPSFDAMAEHFHVTIAQIQQTLTSYILAFSVATLFVGAISDAFGRKPVILVSLVGFFISSIALANAPNYSSLILFRALQGIFGSAGSVVGQAIIRDYAKGTDARKLMSNIMMIFGVAPALAPIIGGYLQHHFDWEANFYFMAAFSCALFISYLFLMEETHKPADRLELRFGAVTSVYAMVLSNKTFVLRTLAIASIFAGVGVYISSASGFVKQVLHLEVTQFAWLFIPMVSGMVIGSSLSSYFATKINAKNAVSIGLTIMAISASVNILYNLFATPTIPWAIIPLFFYAMGMTFIGPILSLSALDLFPNHRGLASSIQNFMRMLLFAFVSGVVSPFVYNDGVKLALGLSGCLIIGAILRQIAKPATAQTKRPLD